MDNTNQQPVAEDNTQQPVQAQQTPPNTQAPQQPIPEANTNQIVNEGLIQPIKTVEAQQKAQQAQETTNTQQVTPTKKTQQEVYGKSEMLDYGQILQNILQIQNGDMVADLGAGGGLPTMQASRLVGEQGQVYSVDIVKGTLSEIESKARMTGVHNIKTIWSNLEIVGATKINEGSLDFALLFNILFQSKKHYEILAEAARLLKVNGKLLIVDWSDTSQGFSPDDSMKVDQTQVIEYARQNNLILDRDFQAGKYHFGLIFIKKE